MDGSGAYPSENFACLSPPGALWPKLQKGGLVLTRSRQRPGGPPRPRTGPHPGRAAPAETRVVGNKAASVRQASTPSEHLMKMPTLGKRQDLDQSQTEPSNYPMSIHETTPIHPPARGVCHPYLVVAADMATYNGNTIDGCQLVMTSAESAEDALGTARAVLEEGFIPVAAFVVGELRLLAEQLGARVLKPGGSYNLATELTDAEVAAQAAEAALEADEL